MNPVLVCGELIQFFLGQKEFRSKFAATLTQMYHTEVKNSTRSLQELWNIINSRTKDFIRRYDRGHAAWRKQQLSALRKRRQRQLRNSLRDSILAIHLPPVEQQIQAF